MLRVFKLPLNRKFGIKIVVCNFRTDHSCVLPLLSASVTSKSMLMCSLQFRTRKQSSCFTYCIPVCCKTWNSKHELSRCRKMCKSVNKKSWGGGGSNILCVKYVTGWRVYEMLPKFSLDKRKKSLCPEDCWRALKFHFSLALKGRRDISPYPSFIYATKNVLIRWEIISI